MAMVDLIKQVIIEGTTGSFNAIKSIAMIVIPLMLFMEVAKEIKLLDFIGKLFKPVTRFFNASETAAFPLAVGLIFGISYGAGVLIKATDDGQIDKNSLYIIAIFLAVCHAIVEDTLLFVAIGSIGWIILVVRVCTAILTTAIFSRWRVKL